MNRLFVLALFGLVGCSGDAGTNTDTKTDGTDDTTGDDTTGDDDPTVDTVDTGPQGPQYFDPVAVGFEFSGGILPDGELTNYVFDPYEILGGVLITFASKEFFGAADAKEQAQYSCAMFAPLIGPALVPPNQIPNDDAVALYSSYEVALAADPKRSDCAGRVDPKVWGANAENLLQPWVGAHFGLGFGPMTDYLRDGWSKDTLDTYGNFMVASYIAINNASGTWIGEDWTTTFVWEWDPVTQTPSADDKGFLIGVDVSTLAPGNRLPTAFLDSNAYWYQDFPLLDFSNLTDGAP